MQFWISKILPFRPRAPSSPSPALVVRRPLRHFCSPFDVFFTGFSQVVAHLKRSKLGMEPWQDDILASHAVAAATAVSIGSALTHPLDTLKTLVQVGSGPNQKLTATQVLHRVQPLSWIPGFYGGLGWATLGRISGMGARFGTYEILTAYFKDGREENYVSLSEALLAGFAAGATEAVLSTPFEFFKLRAQVSSAFPFQASYFVEMKQSLPPSISKLLGRYTPDRKAWDLTLGLLESLPKRGSNISSALKEYPWLITGSGRPPFAYEIQGPSGIISLEGWGALWRGLRSGIFRDSIFGGVFFSSWQFLHIVMLDWKAVAMNPPPRSIEEIGPVSPLASSLAAGFCGSLAAAVSHCFDTAKCRTQCTVIPKYISLERRLLKWKPPGYWLERVSGLSPTDRSILFRGIWLRMAGSGLASFAVVGGYFWAINNLV